MSGLQVDVADLAGKPGAAKRISRPETIADLRVPLGWVEETEPVEIALLAESVIEGVALSGTISGIVHLACSRCLAEFEERFSHPVDEVFGFPGKGEDYEIAGNVIDLEPLIRDLVVLGIPARPLHDPECKGLCPVCGADLNTGDCGHRREVEDLRWAPLRSLVLEEDR